MSISSDNLTPGMIAAMHREPASTIGLGKSKGFPAHTPTDKECLKVGSELAAQVQDACPLGEEIKGLHEPFIQWCNLHRILYVHANPTKKSSVQKGQADFICLLKGCGAAVEFKALEQPEAGLSQDQKDWRDWANRCGVPVLVTNSLAAAIKFVTRELEL